MRKNISLVVILLTLSCCGAASAAGVPDIGIGGAETNPATHLRFEGISKEAKIVSVSTHVIVDQAAPVGLNFFAVQVNFPNHTWAHGGLQINSGAEKANWGGLVNRGGGAKDYKEVNWQEDLLLIEYGVGKPNTVPFKWDRNCEYIVTIERGNQIHLPAGTNQQFNVTVPERTMWEWKLTIKPVADGPETFTSLLYDSAGYISSFYLWNESGYGSKSNQQRAKWSLPTYRTEDSAEDKVPTGWKRF